LLLPWGGGLLGLTAHAATQSASTDLSLTIDSIIALSVTNCDTTSDPDSSRLNIHISPNASTDTYGANCQVLSIDTNAPGYTLSTKANSNDATNNLTYQNPTTVSPLPFIPALPITNTPTPNTGTPTNPTTLISNSWGFAVANKLGFDSAYTTNPGSTSPSIATGKFANLPTTGTTIADTTTMPISSDNFTFYYATSVPATKMAGTYSTTITYTAIAKPVPEPPEVFKFTIDTRMTDTLFADGDTPITNPAHFAGTATTFSIPTSGYVNAAVSHPYTWIINCGDGTPDRAVSGTSHTSNAPGVNGIFCDYGPTGSNTGPGEYQITIKSVGAGTPGWMNGFGFYGTSGASTQANKNLFKSIDTPLTNNMRTPGSSYRFYDMFFGARNAAQIPADLFSKISTNGSTNMSNMFSSTFMDYAYNSTTATIPFGLFGSIDTSSATNLSSMLSITFARCAHSSTIGTIPNNLLSFVDTSSATNLAALFDRTFGEYAYANKLGGTPDTDINNIFGSADLSSITASNASSVFYRIFMNMPSLTGTAQIFIDTKFSHWSVPRVPASATQAFLGTGVTDLASLDANWK